jgi:hypothetical protein
MYKQAVQFVNAFRHLATLLNADRKLFLSSTVDKPPLLSMTVAARRRIAVISNGIHRTIAFSLCARVLT